MQVKSIKIGKVSTPKTLNPLVTIAKGIKKPRITHQPHQPAKAHPIKKPKLAHSPAQTYPQKLLTTNQTIIVAIDQSETENI
jgi:hypothetical protein